MNQEKVDVHARLSQVPEFDETLRNLVSILSDNGAVDLKSNKIEITVRDPEADEDSGITLTIDRDPVDVIASYYGKLMSLNSEDPDIKEELKAIASDLAGTEDTEGLIDSIELQDAIITTTAYAIRNSVQSGDAVSAANIMKIFAISKGLRKYAGQVSVALVSIGDSEFDAALVVAGNGNDESMDENETGDDPQAGISFFDDEKSEESTGASAAMFDTRATVAN